MVICNWCNASLDETHATNVKLYWKDLFFCFPVICTPANCNYACSCPRPDYRLEEFDNPIGGVWRHISPLGGLSGVEKRFAVKDNEVGAREKTDS